METDDVLMVYEKDGNKGASFANMEETMIPEEGKYKSCAVRRVKDQPF